MHVLKDSLIKILNIFQYVIVYLLIAQNNHIPWCHEPPFWGLGLETGLALIVDFCM